MRWTQEAYEQYLAKRANSAGGAPSCAKPALPMILQPSTDVLKLNKTERAYWEWLSRRPEFAWVGCQNITLKLADDTRFTPDFSTLDGHGNMTFYDVKGFQREDALIKIKVAARLFGWATFVLVTKNGHEWTHKEVKP